MNTNTSLWQQELLRAPTAQHVVDTVQDYVVLWKPDEIRQLPEPLDLEALAEPAYVSEYAALLLMHADDAGKRAPAREALTAFFLIAARRLSEIAARPEPEVEQEREPASTAVLT